MIILKNRSQATNWPVSHSAYANTSLSFLDVTDAVYSSVGTRLQRTSSTVFTVGDAADYSVSNFNGNSYVAYCFAPVSGYSSFGSYPANGSTDGPFVYTGFRPRWVLLKRSDSTESWIVIDTARDSYNLSVNNLFPNLSIAEQASASLDILSNGFKLKSTSTGGNTSGGTYIYAAFAESPFQYARAR
jgi:hypothetical protein